MAARSIRIGTDIRFPYGTCDPNSRGLDCSAEPVESPGCEFERFTSQRFYRLTDMSNFRCLPGKAGGLPL